MKTKLLFITSILIFAIISVSACGEAPTITEVPSPEPTIEPTSAPTPESQFPSAELINDEGGPIIITGEVEYTNPFFTAGVAEPIVILEDQAGFVDRDRNFIFPVESQVLGQITSDFYTSPFTYSLTLPLVPKGTLRDVDNDQEEDTGVMIFAVAYWTNTWGDAYLEKRDQGGGGWSGAYASTRVSDDRDNYLEIYGGKYVVYAPDEKQGFPSNFGNDGLLFTEDDPMVQLPKGWTIVDLDTDPFTFDRSQEPKIDLLEPESIALVDLSEMSYTEAFEAMLEKMRTEYAFTEYKGIDWEALKEEFLPRFEEAEDANDTEFYYFVLRDFLWSIPDGHIGMELSPLYYHFQNDIAGGLGMAIQELDDGRVIVTHIFEDEPASEAGIEFGAEIIEINDQPIGEAISQTIPWSSPFSTEHNRRLQQLRYVIRFPLGSEVKVTFKNPDGPLMTETMQVSSEIESFNVTSLYADVTGFELPVEFEMLDDGYGYVKVTDFFDNELLTIQLWERMIEDLNDNNVPGLIIDLRMNTGGSGYLADQMAAYFFDEELVAGNTAFYDDSTGEFYLDPGDENTLFPPREELRYYGSIVAIVGPACSSACEFFAYNLTLQDRATIVGHYPTAGLGGSVEDFVMPEDINVRFTIGRAVGIDGDIHIEGRGVEPDIDIPMTEETVSAEYLDESDVLLEQAIEVIRRPRGAGITPSGPPKIATQEEALFAVQASAPFLEDLAQEIHDEELFEPATVVYNVPMGRSQEVLWVTLWCASPEQFDQNWENITLVMTLDGEEVPLDRFVNLENPSEEMNCRYYFTALSEWPIGEHVLTTEMTFATQLDDGMQDQLYAPGTRVYEYHVYVSR
jgi:C-terminal processing protease CtpA/Prc